MPLRVRAGGTGPDVSQPRRCGARPRRGHRRDLERRRGRRPAGRGARGERLLPIVPAITLRGDAARRCRVARGEQRGSAP
ncbi:MAG: hypothetical protein FJ275_08690 [Planctomycetes bacterium]|nr:hypothetical protein [Planctomycetota bacterium]